jgi:outer membrane lipoprotein-sorting protein
LIHFRSKAPVNGILKIAKALIYVAICTLCQSAAHGVTTSYAIDPKAMKVLTEMQTAYSSMNSLSEEIVGAESQSVPHRMIVHTEIRILRPGYISMVSDSKSSRSGSSMVVTDGSYCYVTAPQYPARYLKFRVPATADALLAALNEGILSSFTLNLFANPTAASSMFSDKTLATLQLAHPVKVDGVETDVVVVSDRNGVALTLFLDRDDHLVRKIVAIDPNKPGNFTETYSSIKRNATLSASSFTFVTPPNAAPYFESAF